MGTNVRIHADLRADLRRHLAWLSRNRDAAYVERLRDELSEAIDLLGEFPEAGRLEREEDRYRLRKLLLRSLPYAIWYVVGDRPRGSVWMVRLFHARQDRPAPGIHGRWRKR